MTDRAPSPRRRSLLVALGFEAGIGVIGVGAAALFGVALTPTLTLTGEDVLVSAVGVGVLTLMLIVVVRSSWPPFRNIRVQLDRSLRVFFRNASIPALLALSLVAGFSEELFFRGFLQQGLEDLMPTIAAVAAANTLFALAHLITPTYGILALLMGGVLSAVFILSDSLIATALAHALYDFIALAYYLRRPVAAGTSTRDQKQEV
ncbi:MAG: CPBP family intramembrane glutamic endopeptidase [bacterium]